MEKLELKHLAPYLPYKLRLKNIGETYHDLIGLCNKIEGNEDVPCDFIVDELQNEYYIEGVKPILRPMSDLTKEIDFRNDGSKIVFIKTFMREHRMKLEKELKVTNGKLLVEYLDFGIVEKMLKYHFDVFGLIDKGLAIDINSIT